jgi:protein required for attachment to host cells
LSGICVLQEGVTWFLLADGRRARVLAEARRGAPLAEPGEWELTIGADELFGIQDRPPRAHDRLGPSRHAMDEGRNLHEEEEARFLQRLAQRLEAAEKQKAFAHLVIAAPPRALGILRDMLAAAVKTRIRAEIDKDLIDEDTDKLRARLADLLRG